MPEEQTSQPAQKNTEPEKVEEQVRKVAKKKSWWTFNSKLIEKENPIRREVLFFLVVFISTTASLWGWGHGWQLYKEGLNPNLFHETLGTILSVFFIVWAFFKLYMTSDTYVTEMEARKAAEEAAETAKREAEQARKDKAFTKIVIAFEAAKTFEERARIMGDLLAVGVESPSLRQRVVNALKTMNDWILENKIYLRTQNLVSWRLKNNLFEISSRFRENAETQDASIKTINIIESIIRKHLEEFIAGHNTTTLDLSEHCLPTLNLSAKEIPAGSLKMTNGNYWQSSFSESHLYDMSFADSDLYGGSFWRSDLNNVDFTGTVIQSGKLRTNLQQVTGLSAEEFFATKEWDLCLLSKAQESEFFGENPNEQETKFSKWLSSKIRRDKLYFGIDRI